MEKLTTVIAYGFSSFGKGSDPLYDGSRLIMETQENIYYVLEIMFYENSRHFQPILNVVDAGFCSFFHKSFNRVQDHKSKNKCHKCKHSPSTKAFEVDVFNCDIYLRSFFGDICFQNHL